VSDSQKRPPWIERYSLESPIESGPAFSLWWARERPSGRECVVCLVDISETGSQDRQPASHREVMAFAQGKYGQSACVIEHGEWEGVAFFVVALAATDRPVQSRRAAIVEGSRPSAAPSADAQKVDAGPEGDHPSPVKSRAPRAAALGNPAQPWSESPSTRLKWLSNPGAVALLLALVTGCFLLLGWLWPEDPDRSERSTDRASIEDRTAEGLDPLSSVSSSLAAAPGLAPTPTLPKSPPLDAGEDRATAATEREGPRPIGLGKPYFAPGAGRPRVLAPAHGFSARGAPIRSEGDSPPSPSSPLNDSSLPETPAGRDYGI
jgi:hypothetical protein